MREDLENGKLVGYKELSEMYNNNYFLRRMLKTSGKTFLIYLYRGKLYITIENVNGEYSAFLKNPFLLEELNSKKILKAVVSCNGTSAYDLNFCNGSSLRYEEYKAELIILGNNYTRTIPTHNRSIERGEKSAVPINNFLSKLNSSEIYLQASGYSAGVHFINGVLKKINTKPNMKISAEFINIPSFKFVHNPEEMAEDFKKHCDNKVDFLKVSSFGDSFFHPYSAVEKFTNSFSKDSKFNDDLYLIKTNSYEEKWGHKNGNFVFRKIKHTKPSDWNPEKIAKLKKARYKGEIVGNKIEGYGEMSKFGYKYIGNFRNGKRNGIGKKIKIYTDYKDVILIEGLWKKNRIANKNSKMAKLSPNEGVAWQRHFREYDSWNIFLEKRMSERNAIRYDGEIKPGENTWCVDIVDSKVTKKRNGNTAEVNTYQDNTVSVVKYDEKFLVGEEKTKTLEEVENENREYLAAFNELSKSLETAFKEVNENFEINQNKNINESSH